MTTNALARQQNWSDNNGRSSQTQSLGMSHAKILVLDNDVDWTLKVSDSLIRKDFEVFSANTVQDAMLLLDMYDFDLLILEMNMPGVEPMEFLEQIRQMHANVSIIVNTATPSITQAVQAMKLGVTDYSERLAVTGSINQFLEKLNVVVCERSTASPKVVEFNSDDRGLLSHPTQGFFGLLSENPRMHEIFELIQTVANSFASVVIHGETGTGKELIARAIHDASSRHGRPYVTLDCSTLARELLESELFGHEKGAFTGASERHIGRFERANGGTLFLDEVSNIDMAVQAKLLRVLQTKTFERVGGQKSISVDVRIVAATNRALETCIEEGTFREDLYHRLNVVQIELPPLRERVDDIVLLASEFLKRFARENRKDVRGFSSNAVTVLSSYGWPGNVRELENVVLQAVVLAKSPLICAEDLPRRILSSSAAKDASSTKLTDQLGEPEKQILIDTLQKHKGNIKRTAQALEISRTTLYAKLKKYQIDPSRIR